LNTLRKEVLRGDARPFWWTASIGPGETVDRAFGGALVPIRGAPARVSLSLFGSCVDAVPQSLRILMNGVECSVATWDSPFERTLDVLVPGQAIKPANVLALENRTSQPNVVEPHDDLGRPKKNRLLVASATFTYETRLQSPAVTRAQIVAHVVGSGSKAPRRLAVDNRVQSGFQTFDPVAGRVWRGELIDVADADDVPLAVVTAGGAYDPVAVAKIAPRPNPGTGGDYVVVTTARFRRVVEPLVQHRKGARARPARRRSARALRPLRRRPRVPRRDQGVPRRRRAPLEDEAEVRAPRRRRGLRRRLQERAGDAAHVPRPHRLQRRDGQRRRLRRLRRRRDGRRGRGTPPRAHARRPADDGPPHDPHGDRSARRPVAARGRFLRGRRPLRRGPSTR
jgi:hypothetical protein